MKTPHFITGKITKTSLFLIILTAMTTTYACSKKAELTPADASKIEASRTETAHASDWQEHVNPKVWRAFYDTFRGKPSGGHTLRDDMNEVAFNALIQSGADINVRDEDGKTLLMATKEPDVIEALIKAGIDVNARDSEGRTALESTSMQGTVKDEQPLCMQLGGGSIVMKRKRKPGLPVRQEPAHVMKKNLRSARMSMRRMFSSQLVQTSTPKIMRE